MKNKKALPRYKGCHTDTFYSNLYKNLKSDFQPYLETEEFVPRADLKNFRDLGEDPKRFYRSVEHFKRSYQLNSLLKRYRFQHDKFSQQELESKTFEKFLNTQERLAAHWSKPLPLRAELVIQKAREHAKRILGDYSLTEHVELGKWGVRAAVGHPSTRRFLDLKITGPYTGSQEHIDWFKNHVLPGDDLLRRFMVGSFEVCDTLKLTNVPKTFKSLRSILPNTLIGGFYSYGLGRVVQDRLTSEGLDIRYLQNKHRAVIQKFSRTRSHVTADLTAASDSFVGELVQMLLPEDWYSAFALGRISKVSFKGISHEMKSFMTMGIGFTFQLQTLLFYVLIRGIQDCLSKTGYVSVYGDDLIYPRNIHLYVRQIFNDIGFILNDDKTFVEESFRESCGADYYCGVDVRPFQPEGQAQSLSRSKYVCLLYKTYNGILQRWKEFQVQKTLNFLKIEILSYDPFLCQVPPSFPDYSGIRTESIQKDVNGFQLFQPVTMNGTRYSSDGITNLCLKFVHYTYLANYRPVVRLGVYFWNKLRVKHQGIQPLGPYDTDDDIDSLVWLKTKTRPWVSNHTGICYKYKLVAHVASGTRQIVREHTEVSMWD